MAPEVPIVVTLFVCIAYAIKVVVEARARGKLLAANRSDEIMRTLLLNDERQRRHSSLRWGIIFTCLAAGFALVQLMGWERITAGVVAVLLAAVGIGSIVSFAVSRRLELERPPA